jgi:hypothetical protein
MSGKNNHKKIVGTVEWILNGFDLHAEKQVQTLDKLHTSGLLSPEIQKSMMPYVKAFADSQFKKEVLEELTKDLMSEETFIKDRVFGLISAPTRTARAIGHVIDDQARVRRYHAVGAPKMVVCTKHCGPKSTSTKGFNYYVEYDDGVRDIGLHCEKCVAELSAKQNRGRLAAMLGLKKNKDDRTHDRSSRSDTKAKAKSLVDRLTSLSNGQPETPKPTKVNVAELSFSQLRDLAKERGLTPIPRSKVALVTALTE